MVTVMPFCPKCGSEVRLEAAFCHNCGAELKAPPVNISPTPHRRAPFDLRKHIADLRRDGLTKPKDFDLIPEDYERVNWDTKIYVDAVSGSLLNGGFSYFTYLDAVHEESVEGAVRKRTPILLRDEQLDTVAQIKVEWGGWGTTWGLLYFTGRRFILDAEKARFPDAPEGAVPSLPLTSFWIKPDFSDLFSLLDVSFFLEQGTFRKKRFNTLIYSATAMEGSPSLRCGYMAGGPGGEQFMNDEYEQFWSSVERTHSIQHFSKNINDMIAEARKTNVSELIEHTYTCHHMMTAIIETNPLSGPKGVSENPFSYWPLFLV